MHFKLPYVMNGMRLDLKDKVLNFPYGGEHRILVKVLDAVDGNDPTKRTLVCEGISERNVDDSIEGAFQQFNAGVPLGMTQRSFFNKVLAELFDYMQKTVMVLRWRCSIVDGPIGTFTNGREAYSFDGT